MAAVKSDYPGPCAFGGKKSCCVFSRNQETLRSTGPEDS
jgi:hypothetical protein